MAIYDEQLIGGAHIVKALDPGIFVDGAPTV